MPKEPRRNFDKLQRNIAVLAAENIHLRHTVERLQKEREEEAREFQRWRDAVAAVDIKTLCGLSELTIQAIVNEVNKAFPASRITREEVLCVYVYMHNGGFTNKTLQMMRLLHPSGGWGRTQGLAKMSRNLIKISALSRIWLCPRPEFRKPFPGIGLFMEDGEYYQYAIDTVPLYVQEMRRLMYDRNGKLRNLYNAKYDHAIMKVLVAVNMRGFAVHVSPSYHGNVSDTDVYDTCGVKEALKLCPDGNRALVDGGFAGKLPDGTPRLEMRRPVPRQTMYASDWTWKERERCLQQNQTQAHFRARVEHIFSPSLFNRWSIFQLVRVRSQATLDHLVNAAFVALNIELFCYRGMEGRYREYDDEDILMLHHKFREHEQQSHRYPIREKDLDKMHPQDRHLIPELKKKIDERKKKKEKKKAKKETRDTKTQREIAEGTQRTLEDFGFTLTSASQTIAARQKKSYC